MRTWECVVFIGDEELTCGVPMEVLKSLCEFGIVDLGIEAAQHRSDVRVWYEISKREGFECAVRWVLVFEVRTLQKCEYRGKLTVPPMKDTPSSRSSSSMPDMPITYTFLSLGSFITEEMYTAAA